MGSGREGGKKNEIAAGIVEERDPTEVVSSQRAEETRERVARLEAVVEARVRSERRRGPRGAQWQRTKREAEGHARRSAVEAGRFLVLEGEGRGRAAAALGIHPRTLRRWEEGFELKRGIWVPRGRRVERSSLESREGVALAAELFGPGVSARLLLRLFDRMPRREVIEILTEYRLAYAREHPLLLQALSWRWPGAVWAMDHAVAPGPKGERKGRILAVRDLGSGYQILWLLVEDETARVVIGALKRCFEVCGAPLVLKSDSGPAFISRVMAGFLRSCEVKHILSPPRRPQYNGSVEASIRWLKVRTEREARAAGRPGAWRREDMERARREANAALRRRVGVAEELWLAREPIGEDVRRAFTATVAREELAVLSERGLGAGDDLPVLLRRAVSRQAIRRALVAHGILHIERRLDPPPINTMTEDNAA